MTIHSEKNKEKTLVISEPFYAQSRTKGERKKVPKKLTELEVLRW
jgi:hypothetical protein